MQRKPGGPMIRLASIADLPAIVHIYNEAIAQGDSVADTDPVTTDSRMEWFAAHDEQRRPLWVLELDGELIAWIGVQSYSPLLAFVRTAEVSLFVAAAHQGLGYGTRLLSHVVAVSPQLGVEVLIGTAFGHNVRVIRLNERAGFRHWGRLPGVAEVNGESRDLTIMGLALKGRGA